MVQKRLQKEGINDRMYMKNIRIKNMLSLLLCNINRQENNKEDSIISIAAEIFDKEYV